ncbi:hypothetical protein PVAND_002254 [Polypedilum vanderplanki]|uniref:Uncharacterized protein n=1 Tax=Polypedilum vanderplanki TaxID=319348 RepID=A0A9J6BRM9_POLVA|nr:hypothetical protein PVAND_002254 [Polypedilum vanderplanki]
MYKWNGRVAIVTGASTPIGMAICKALVTHGLKVCAIAKKSGVAKLDALNTTFFDVKGKMLTYECDLTDEEQVKAVFRHIGEKYDGIDLLVNNANVMKKGLLLDQNNTNDMHYIMNTNVLALCIVTREAVKLMRQRTMERKDVAHIVNINSIFGHKIMATVPGTTPMNGLYPASKYASTAITECVRQELLFLDETVKVTSISPGLVESDIIHANAHDEILKLMPALKPDDVAGAVIFALGAKEGVEVHEIVIKPVGEYL